MKINLNDHNLSQLEKTEIENLLTKAMLRPNTELQQIWQLMDLVWDEYDCDNKKLNLNNIDKFYYHPVWLLNGLFIEQHALSMQHRNAISNWISNKASISKILDYGGGFGTLARLIVDKNPSLLVDIYELHPSDYAKQRITEYRQIRFINDIHAKYDVLVSTDVLEHVPDPLKTFGDMILSVKDNGYLIIANNFFPRIKCHLPRTFHLRYTFNLFAKFMGLVIICPLEESHATIFKKNSDKPVNWSAIRLIEIISKGIFPMIEFLNPILRPVFKLIKHEHPSS